MYNGIGLPTPRGSGTNGYVQKNLAHVKKASKQTKVSEPDADFERPPNPEIANHEKKRKIEANCLRLRLELEEEGWKHDKIEREVDHYRKRKLEQLSKESKQ